MRRRAVIFWSCPGLQTGFMTAVAFRRFYCNLFDEAYYICNIYV
jgi:hypothetical protein